MRPGASKRCRQLREESPFLYWGRASYVPLDEHGQHGHPLPRALQRVLHDALGGGRGVRALGARVLRGAARRPLAFLDDAQVAQQRGELQKRVVLQRPRPTSEPVWSSFVWANKS